ncbi:reverse transcriptase domain-containing protein [Tanacetum coccineum]|uniref:Reverse transcriptase domain-containing protein n=1 Tax=Tanacetum coccineum TaxID=301880 RepID=A0ABQ5GXD8_9ASTR
MADNRTMAQMLQAPIEGYEDAIVVPPINANNFELKQPLINLVQSNKFTDGEARDWLDKEPPRSILTWDDLVSKFINQFFPPSKTTYYRNEIITFYQKPNETFNEAWERFKGLLRQKLEDPGKFLIPCALQELNRTNALADSRASINLLPHSIYKKLELEALTPTRMTLELANRSITHPMGIAEDVVVRVDGFTFLADFVVVNFEPNPRVPIILGRPFLRTAKALIDLYEEKLTLRVGKGELVYYADKSEKNKEKNYVHAISIIDFSKDDPFSGSTTNTPLPSSSSVKTSDNFEKFADELTPLDSLPPDLKKDLTILFDSSESSIIPSPLLDSDSPFTAELLASVTLNSLRNEDKVFKPGKDKLKNHKKTIKNGQARTRESEEYKAEARKVKPLGLLNPKWALTRSLGPKP